MVSLVGKGVRFLYRALAPEGVKNTLKLYLLFEKQDVPPEPITGYAERHVLVLAPHMDDEVVGCGGTLRKHVLCGSPVTVVYMTDGCRGNPDLYRQGLPPNEVREAERELSARRKDEAVRSCRVIGVGEQVFLGEPDGGLEPTPATVTRVRELIRDRVPSVVYLPSLLDQHRDHWAANRVLREAMAGVIFPEGTEPVLRGYEVWTPLFPNRLSDIGDVIEIKERALREFASQVARVDYARVATALNAYRSIYRDRGRGYSEAFFEMSVGQHALIIRRFGAQQ